MSTKSAYDEKGKNSIIHSSNLTQKIVKDDNLLTRNTLDYYGTELDFDEFKLFVCSHLVDDPVVVQLGSELFVPSKHLM